MSYFMKDIVGIYKPIGPTSHDMIDEVRKITGEKKVGHAGTLDPLASGVLVVGIGREATKKLKDIEQKEKEYVATFRFGEESTTDDEEGEKKKIMVDRVPTQKEIEKALAKFKGVIEQVPPAFSAVKQQGKKAYEQARKGKELSLKPRKVTIIDIELLEYTWPVLTLRVVTGPGVYIRALARDLGRKLGVGAYVKSLERTRVGTFTKEKAQTLEMLRGVWNNTCSCV